MTELFVGATPKDLIPGNPEDAEALASQFGIYAQSAGEAATKLRAIDHGVWVGPAAQAFRAVLTEQPNRLGNAAKAFSDAQSAMRLYASVLRDSQAQAARAIAIFEEATRQSQVWQGHVQDYQDTLRQAEAQGRPEPSDLPPPLTDPGGHDIERARKMLEQAQADMKEIGWQVGSRLEAAASLAPQQPSLLARAIHGAGEFAGGAWDATTEMVSFAFKLSPAYLLINPKGYFEHVDQTVAGIAYGVTHPVAFAKAASNWDMWFDNPARALGQLVPGLVLAVTTGGGGVVAKGAGAVSRVARRADEMTGLGKVSRALRGFERAREVLPGGTHLVGKGDPLARYLPNVRPKPGYYDVAVHGSPRNFAVLHGETWETVSHRTMAKFIKGHTDYEGGPIRLMSCNTGACDTGAAQKLADKLGTEVIAPTHKLWVHQDGRLSIGPKGNLNTGDWRRFEPRRQR